MSANAVSLLGAVIGCCLGGRYGLAQAAVFAGGTVQWNDSAFNSNTAVASSASVSGRVVSFVCCGDARVLLL